VRGGGAAGGGARGAALCGCEWGLAGGSKRLAGLRRPMVREDNACGLELGQLLERDDGAHWPAVMWQKWVVKG